ncbi:anaerobic dehydrogenase, typically selenocysteine-containing protein [Methylophaga aminisulfidivorans MP]|uniref:Anaerobic dehydrogenase, typically selenocysteine-containing protein n=2 Tax=Methylophaga TaxID=40222 RepID=F5SUW1_9GAMM|nr:MULTISPECIES: molybdopterin oxidoreductase family protein [Methylophaga]EGL55547.1 anaerobic dehydrogenase, typically selenocysteine-containing protein [Methylophaga aminisulfidivorans MP]GLP98853.1 molybdopterin oxidoreductase [Methylophaga thalassica]
MASVLKTTHHGGCPHDCPDTCSMVYEVENGQLTSVKGNKEHPMTRGGLCVKLKDYEKRHYHPDRLLYPMRRSGPKGSGQFERISWDEALDEITTRWKAIIDEYGPHAIIPYSYLGNQGLVHGLNGGDAFFNKMGATVCERTFCGEGSCTAWLLTVGPTAGVDPESFIHSKYIVIWGCNSVSTNVHHWHIVKDAQKNGAKVVVIDPYKSKTAKEADWHIAPKPGTDGALAMAMMHVIIKEGLQDQDYIDNYTVGFDALAERAKTRTPEWAATITGISADDIRQFAREFATTQPAAIRLGVAVERNYGGGQAIRAITCLPALTGAWRHVGGGALQFPVWEHPYKFDVICRPDLIPEGTPVVNAIQIGRALTGELKLDTPIKSMMCWNANPVTQAAETNKIVEGLMREDLFLVAAEHFLSDTASFADIVLPASMGAEMEDMVLSWGHLYLTYNEKCVDSPGEAIPNNEIFRRLAARMGYQEENFSWSDSECLENYVDWDSPACEGIDLAYLREHGFAKLKVGTKDDRAPHREGNFPTPSGKCELEIKGATNFVAGPFRQMYDGFQPGEALDSLPDYVSSREIPEANPQLAEKYPLNIISPKSHGFLNSCYANMENKIKGQGEQFVMISPIDADLRNIQSGDVVSVFNDRGMFKALAQITDDVSPGIVVATLGYWRQLNNGTVNCVSSAEFVDMGHAPTFTDNLVQVALSA